jgi:hypothetical protein
MIDNTLRPCRPGAAGIANVTRTDPFAHVQHSVDDGTRDMIGDPTGSAAVATLSHRSLHLLLWLNGLSCKPAKGIGRTCFGISDALKLPLVSSGDAAEAAPIPVLHVSQSVHVMSSHLMRALGFVDALQQFDAPRSSNLAP